MSVKPCIDENVHEFEDKCLTEIALETQKLRKHMQAILHHYKNFFYCHHGDKLQLRNLRNAKNHAHILVNKLIARIKLILTKQNDSTQ